MKHLAFLLLIGLSACASQPEPPAATVADAASIPPRPARYYSDYFVFVSDDGGDPLVVPIDLNWEQQAPGTLFVERKAYYGTAAPWPMIYEIGTQPLHGPVPERWQAVPQTDRLRWTSQYVAFAFDESGPVQVTIPSFEAEIQGDKTLQAARTTVTVDGHERWGWLIHETVRMDGLQKTGGVPSRLAHFHWMPIVVDRTLYLFEEDGEKARQAVRWRTVDEGVAADTLSTFTFLVAGSTTDTESGRAHVPARWHIEAPEWDLVLDLRSTAGHTGYGDATERGKALFRQALLIGSTREGRPAHGMLELILAD